MSTNDAKDAAAVPEPQLLAQRQRRRAEVRNVIAMSIPVVITTSSRALMDIVDYLMITRLPGAYPTRCRAVVHNGIVSMFAISTEKSSSLYEQTKSALAQVDANLAEANSSKDRILTALVFITDMSQKDEMNRAWDEWADRVNPPMRACVAAGLTGDSLIEIVLTAAV